MAARCSRRNTRTGSWTASTPIPSASISARRGWSRTCGRRWAWPQSRRLLSSGCTWRPARDKLTAVKPLWVPAIPFVISLACSGATVGSHVGWQDSGYFLSARSEEHTSELQSQSNLVCRLLLEKKKKRGYEPDPGG